MPMIVLDQGLTERILEQRRALGNRTRDEVWDGVTYIMPEPTNEHLAIAGFFYGVFWTVFGLRADHRVLSTPNLSDRAEGWTENFRNPDFAYFSPATQAEDHDTHWY